MAVLEGYMHMVGAVVALDTVIANQRLSEIQRLDGKVEQAPCVIAANLPLEQLLTRGETENGLPPAASGCAVAREVCLEQRDPITAFCQMQRRRAAGDT